MNYTPRIKFLLEEVLYPMFDGVPQDSVLLNLITKLSQVNLYKRTKVRYYESETLVNVYALNFMPSGEGKDVVLNWIDKNLLPHYRKEFAKSQAEYIDDRLELIEREAEAKFKKSGATKENYIEQHRPRILAMEASDGTLEGFLALREAYAEANFGGTFIKISEFGDYITSENNNRREFMSAITEVYDNGNTKAKIIKSEKDYRDVEGVPCSINFHTSLSGLLEGEAKKKLLDFLNRGIGRRAFTCVPEKVSVLKHTNYQERRAYLDKIVGNVPEAEEYCRDFVKQQKFNEAFVFTEAADERLFNYRMELFEQAKRSETYAQEALTAEIKNRYWKVAKLAGVIASFEHPSRQIVDVDELDFAIEIGDLYGVHFRKFFDLRELSKEDKLYNYMKAQGGDGVLRTEIRRLGYSGHKDFTGFLKGALENMAERAEEEGLQLVVEKAGKKGERYKIISLETSYADFAAEITKENSNDNE